MGAGRQARRHAGSSERIRKEGRGKGKAGEREEGRKERQKWEGVEKK